MTKTTDALELADETLRQLERGEGQLTPIVLKCLRLARLLENTVAEVWFRLELRGYKQDVRFYDDSTWLQCAQWSGRHGSKTPEGQQQWYLAPIEEIELGLRTAQNDMQALQLMPTSLAETVGQTPLYGQTAAEKILNTILQRRGWDISNIGAFGHIVACLRGAIQEWLVHVVVQLRYGAVVESAFQRAKERFDNSLLTHAPDVARRLAAAYQRAYSDDPEEWSQALTSCRRALKALADRLYPAAEAQPSGRPLTDDYYKNRLLQFASEGLASKSQSEVIGAEIEFVAQRVDALNDLANKGVHSDVNERELELAVVHTYLLAGELLGLLPEPEPKQQLEPPQVDEQGIPGGLGSEGSVAEPDAPVPLTSET